MKIGVPSGIYVQFDVEELESMPEFSDLLEEMKKV